MNLPVPFFVYWLIIRDLSSRPLDVCNNTSNEFGYCISNMQCSHILNGTVIGACTNKETGPICCYKTLNYYNETYYLRLLFGDFNRPNTTEKIMRLNDRAYNMYPTFYNNKTLPSNYKLEIVEYDEQSHICIPPDRIIWPITPLYSEENGKLKFERQISDKSDKIYLITFDKVYDEEKRNITIECLSNLNVSETFVSESEENNLVKYYIKAHKEEIFPLRKFFTPEIQNLRISNYTDDIETLFDVAPERIRRSFYSNIFEEEDSNCEKQHLVDSATVGKTKEQGVPGQFSMSSDLGFGNPNTDRIRSFVAHSESVKKDLMESEKLNEQLEDHKNEEKTAESLDQDCQFHESVKSQTDTSAVKDNIN